MKKKNNILVKRTYIFLGFTTLTLGLLGIFLPLLPTTPFLLLTAYFFSKGSDKYYKKLLNNKHLGKYITNFREGKGITFKTKLFSILSIWIAIGTTVIFFISILWVKIILIVVGLSVSYYLNSLPTLEE